MPSDLHNKLQDLFMKWLAVRATGRGIRAGREIRISDGYVADCLALFSFWNGQLQRFAQKWGMTKRGTYSEQVDWEKVGSNYFSVIVEVKVSRSDFLSTFGSASGKHANRHTPEADLHVIVTPPKLVSIDEVPEFWGLLEQRGAGLSIKKFPLLTPVSDAKRAEYAENILWHSASENLRWGQICERQQAEETMFRKLKRDGMSPNDAMFHSVWRTPIDRE
jgi:hypothetical protein